MSTSKGGAASCRITASKSTDGLQLRCRITNAGGTVYTEPVMLRVFPFLDVPETATYRKALTWAYENGIVKGTDDSHFTPNGSCTRGEFCTMLWRLNGRPSIEGMVNPFADVTPGKGHGTAIVWCYNRKIITGMTDTSGMRVFRSSGKISRTNMIVMLYMMQSRLRERDRGHCLRGQPLQGRQGIQQEPARLPMGLCQQDQPTVRRQICALRQLPALAACDLPVPVQQHVPHDSLSKQMSRYRKKGDAPCL